MGFSLIFAIHILRRQSVRNPKYSQRERVRKKPTKHRNKRILSFQVWELYSETQCVYGTVYVRQRDTHCYQPTPPIASSAFRSIFIIRGYYPCIAMLYVEDFLLLFRNLKNNNNKISLTLLQFFKIL